uniref:Uncharacterized protein n=1 Tax=Brassica campestris TaxID=3711 RepID=A0A3P6D4Y7_BRACM|nr:unnamed protein product [Brassica rapa]
MQQVGGETILNCWDKKNKAADLVSRAAIRARCHYVNKKKARRHVNKLVYYRKKKDFISLGT